jgi:hypothetical protein
MAKKKITGKKKGKKRMGAVKLQKAQQDHLWLGAGVFVGAFGKKAIDWGLSKQTAVTIKQEYIDWGEFLVGGAFFGLVPMHPALKGVALGLSAAGFVNGVIEAGALKGVGALPAMVPFRPKPNLSGVTKTPAVGAGNAYGYPKSPSVGRTLKRSSFYTGAYNAH